MSFLGLYRINGLHKKYFKTAKQLYKRVLNDSESKQEWIASYAELVKVCQKQKFPRKYAKEIMICILNASSNSDSNTKRIHSSTELSEDEKAKYFCYKQLAKSTDEKAITSRATFFASIIDNMIENGPRDIRFLILRDEIYNEICSEWKKTMMEMFYKDELVNIENIKSFLEIDFYNTIINAKNKKIIVTGSRKYNITNRGNNRETR